EFQPAVESQHFLLREIAACYLIRILDLPELLFLWNPPLTPRLVEGTVASANTEY
ncbi:hypothetical protein BgiMline_017759, partial [Biomphalaria glabrata]